MCFLWTQGLRGVIGDRLFSDAAGVVQQAPRPGNIHSCVGLLGMHHRQH